MNQATPPQFQPGAKAGEVQATINGRDRSR